MKIVIGMTRSDTVVSGSFVHIRQMGIYMRSIGWNVIYIIGGQGRAIDVLESDGFVVYKIKSMHRSIKLTSDINAFWEIFGILRRERPNICSWHTAKIGALGRLASFFCGIKTFYVAHGIPFYATKENKGYKAYKLIEKVLTILPAKIICVCDYDANMYKKISIRPSGVIKINNGMKMVDISEKKFENNGVVKFITAARFEPQKDYDTLFRAFLLIKERGYSFELHVYGNGQQENHIKKMFSAMSEVKFCGVSDNFHEKLIACDVFILSAHWEGLPRSIIEAMSCALPIIASDVGGVRELISCGHNGYLIEHLDYKNMADKIQDYICNPKKIREHGLNSNKKFINNYDVDRMLEEYVSEYRK